MPPHPTCFINRTLFDEFGLYSKNYKIAGDFENTGGKAKSTSFKKQEKADSKDGSDKSAKSAIAGK